MGTEHEILRHRSIIAAAIDSNGDPSNAAADLLSTDSTSLRSKFTVIDFSYLLKNNSQSANKLKKLLNALSILEKYGRHLLKPAESRSNMWRHIKFSNAIFRDRVDVINGGRDIMTLMGYTENREDGVAYPEGAQPDHNLVLNLVTDIYYGRKELEAYLEKQHPNPAAITECISPDLRRLLDEEAARTSTANNNHHQTQNMPGSTQQPSNVSHVPRQPVYPGSNFQSQHMPNMSFPQQNVQGSNFLPANIPSMQRQQEQGTNFLPANIPSLSRQQELGTNYQPLSVTSMTQQNPGSSFQPPSVPSMSRQPVLGSSSSGATQSPNSAGSGLYQQPRPHLGNQPTGYQPSNAFQPTASNDYTQPGQSSTVVSSFSQDPRVVTGQSMGQEPSGLMTGHSMGQGQPRVVMSQGHTGVVPGQSLPHDRSGMVGQSMSQDRSGVVVGQSMSLGQNETQSIGLSRNTNAQQQIPSSNPAQESTYTEEFDPKTADIVCDICGDNDADVICEVCDNKQLCKGCDTKWHNHPKRQNHKLTKLRASLPTPSSPTVASQGLPQSPQQDVRMRQDGRNTERNEQYDNQLNERLSQGASLQMNERLSQGTSLQQHKHAMSQNNNQAGQQYQQGMDRDQTQLVHVPVYMQQTSPRANVRYNSPTSPLNQHMTMAGNTGSDRNQSQFQYGQRTSQYGSMSPRDAPMGMPTSGMSEPMVSQMTGGYNVMYSQPMPNMMSYHTGLMQSGQPMPYVLPPAAVHQQYPGGPVSYQPYLPPQLSVQQHHNDRMQRTDDIPAANVGNTLHRSSSSRSSIGESPINQQGFTSTPPNTDDSVRESSTYPSTGRVDSMSELLPIIKAIPNLEKREARLQINMMTLKDDLKEWENKINAIILQNPNFFQDEEYKILNRKKRKHLQELQVLQNYQQELEKEIYNNAEENRRAQEEYERALEVEALRKRSNLLRTGAGEKIIDPTGSMPVPYPGQRLSGPPQEKELINQSAASSTSSPGLVPVGPVTTTYRRPENSQNQSKINTNTKNQSGDDTCPPLRLNSLGNDDNDENIAELRRMLVLDQNPHEFKPSSIEQEFRLSGGNLSGNQGVAFPPHLPEQNEKPFAQNLVMKKGKSEMNLQSGLNECINPMTKSQSASALLPDWQCSHCTYRNPGNTKVCLMCSKTSDNPVTFTPHTSSVTEQTSEEACEVCTFDNPPGSKVCEMCGHTQTKYAVLEADIIRASVTEAEPDINAACDPVQDASVKSDKHISGGAKNLIEMEQDQVYMEKKAAHERYNEMNAASGDTIDITQVVPPPAAQQQGFIEESLGATGVDHSKYGVQASISPTNKTPQKSGEPLKSGDKQLSGANKDVERVRISSGNSGSSSSYNSAASSLGDDPKDMSKVKVDGQGQAKGQKGQPGLNFVEAIEQINLKREQQQMILDGHSFMAELKEAERNGFEIAEVEIALTHCIEAKLSPLEWLKKKWNDDIDIVVTMATNAGKTAEQNNVGEMSHQEARQALIDCHGNLEQAVEMCVNDRMKKYAEISASNEYPREEILTALYQRCGDIEEVLDQLNHHIVQRFTDRLWQANSNGGGDVAIAAAVRMADLGNSVSNSIISHEEFKRAISDMNIDKERRVRMVFIEAKLKSWGRAETVIRILDEEITTSVSPLECDVEDIIEAVRNCGDRRSSLVYLNQECVICFSVYPMSKIRNLSVCNCKLCTSCLQQYFEVAIREHFVRNWGCPNCEAPGLEDEATASQYFELLSLILQNLVSKEVVDLFETKLRDWHLQKDPNFRWCAHCACGFLYDRPGILGMECPSCKEKTCFQCKIKWEPQHEGLTCEQYERWKIDNNPEMQAKGVKLYLEENGIDCPSCKMRYSLAKGGCMHFKCPQCGYEFCSGCYQAFLHQGACKMLKSCNRGLHCHHPRDCYYYLRDYDVPELQKLLKAFKVVYNTTVPPTQEDKTHCQVMEQKEFGTLKKDEACGKHVGDGMAGLCETHYKEYLVSLINKNRLDPVTLMDVQKMKLLIERNEKQPPKLHQNDGEREYRKRLIQFIQEKWPLKR